MALADYDDLQAAIGTWNVNRTDLPAADLIGLAEARLNRDLRLRMMESDNALTGAPGLRTIALPAGFLEPLALFIERDTGREALWFSPDDLDTDSAAGEPRYWTVDGPNLAFERPLDQAYAFTLKMLQGFALSDAAPANWLLSNWPDVYLAACNVEAALYQLDDAQAARWQERYAEAVAAINAKEARSRTSAGLRTDAALRRRRTFDISRGY